MRILCAAALAVFVLFTSERLATAQASPEAGDRPLSATEVETLVERYRSDADEIIAAAMKDSLSWDRLAYLTDTFGPRFSGSEALERAIDWILDEMTADGLAKVRGEPVMVPHWVRGEERLILIEPHERELHILGLG
ncbi:MAG: peptidase M28 family protein, partial [Rhodothermales bacterium]|nr:peptidase M28 family protein [Rhodothermales bacterium]